MSKRTRIIFYIVEFILMSCIYSTVKHDLLFFALSILAITAYGIVRYFHGYLDR